MSIHPITTQSTKGDEAYKEAFYVIRVNGTEVQHFTMAESSTDALNTFCIHFGYKTDSHEATENSLSGYIQTGKGSTGIRINRVKITLSPLSPFIPFND